MGEHAPDKSPWGLGRGGVRTLRVSQSSAARRRRNKIQSRVFRGHAPWKTLCSGEMGRQFRQKSSRISPASFSQKSLDFWEKAHDGSALPCCHASQPAAVPRLPYDSGQTRSGCARPGFCPSLQSIRAVRNGSDASSKDSINSATIWLTSPAGRSILYSVSVTISPPPMGERSAYPC